MISGKKLVVFTLNQVLLFSFICSYVKAIESEPKLTNESFIINERNNKIRYPLNVSALHSSYGYPGAPIFIDIMVENNGTMNINLPLGGEFMSTANNIVIIVSKAGGCQEADCPRYEKYIYEPEGMTTVGQVAEIKPGEMVAFRTWFAPWSDGEYTFKVTFANKITKKLREKPIWFNKEKKKRVIGIEYVEDRISNVWVGKIEKKGKVKISTYEDINERLKPKDHNIDEKGKKLMQKLSEMKRNASNQEIPISQKLSILSSIVEMHNMYATRTLMGIERETRGQAFNRYVVRSMYDMINEGSGYLALKVFIEIALDGKRELGVRMLSVDAIMRFAKEKEIRRGKINIHIISEKERQNAKSAIARLIYKNGELPREIREILNKYNE